MTAAARALMVVGLLSLVLSLSWMPIQAARCDPAAAASTSPEMVGMADPAPPSHRCRDGCPGCSCLPGQPWLQATATVPSGPGLSAGLTYAAMPVRRAPGAARPPDLPPPRENG